MPHSVYQHATKLHSILMLGVFIVRLGAIMLYAIMMNVIGMRLRLVGEMNSNSKLF
jgi:hypothetical protein